MLENKSKQKIPVRGFTDNILEDITDKSSSVSQKLMRIQRSLTYAKSEISDNGIKISNKEYNNKKEYKRNTILKDNTNITYITKPDLYDRDTLEMWQKPDVFRPISSFRENRCVLKSIYLAPGQYKKDIVSMYTPDEISNMLANNDYYGYIQNGDWFELDTEKWTFKFIINIDTYYNLDKTFGDRPHNIDLILNKVEIRTGTYMQPPWTNNTDTKTILDTSPTNSRIERGDNVPIVLGKMASDDWQNYLPKFVEVNDGLGIDPDITLHIVPKIKSVPTRAFIEPKPGAKYESLDVFGYDNGIAYNTNLGKVWFLYEAEIIGYGVWSSNYDAMTCTQYPIFKKYYSRDVIWNKSWSPYPSMTSSLVSKPIYGRQYLFEPLMFSKNDMVIRERVGKQYHPLCGMRFV